MNKGFYMEVTEQFRSQLFELALQLASITGTMNKSDVIRYLVDAEYNKPPSERFAAIKTLNPTTPPEQEL